MKYRVWENLNTLIVDSLVTRQEAIDIAIKYHLEEPDKYHEVYRLEKGKNIGIAQWKPGDCEHHCPKSECPYCRDPREDAT